MLVRDWMTRHVVTVRPRMSVQSARRLLDLHGFRHLPVVEDGRLVGIVSDRDVRVPKLDPAFAALDSDVLTGRHRRVASVLSAPAITVGPDDAVLAAAELMNRHRVGALPVVEDGRLVGVLSVRDCLRAWASQGISAVRDLIVDDHPYVPMPLGDERPGRPQTAATALIVSTDAAMRGHSAEELAAAGFRTVTCPGPRGGALCPALRDDPGGCSRVSEDTAVVVLDRSSRVLARTYERWLPNAEIRIHDPNHAVPA